MARQDLTVTTGTSKDPTAAVSLTETAENTTDHSQFSLTTRDIVVIHNTGASTYTYTVTSVADERGRTGNITTANILAGAIMLLGPLSLEGWRQTDGKLYLDASNTAVKFGIYRMP